MQRLLQVQPRLLRRSLCSAAPTGFTADMLNEVEFLKYYKDLPMLLDDSWQQKIHPNVDGSLIELQLDISNMIVNNDDVPSAESKPQDVKVVMEIPRQALKIDEPTLKIVQQLAGPRWKKNSLKLTCNQYPTREFNHKHCCDVLHQLIQASLDMTQP